VALDEVEPDDVIALDLDDEDAFALADYHLESIMHAEVYRARPDVGSVIHGHPLYGTALGATDADLSFLTHDAVLFIDGIGLYDEGPALSRSHRARPWPRHWARSCGAPAQPRLVSRARTSAGRCSPP